MKIVTAEYAVSLIKSGSTITTGGFGSCGHPEALTAALAERYEHTHTPEELTLVFAAGQGDRREGGLNRLAKEGLIRKAIGGYWGLVPRLAELASTGKIDGYNLPQGIITQLFRATAANSPGIISPVGLHTFVDPRYEGGRLSAASNAHLIELMKIGHQEYLFYPKIPIDCALLRASVVDTHGNVSLHNEVNLPEVLAQAEAARNSGGLVVVQTEKVVAAGEIAPKDVRIPGILVDYVVVSPANAHRQTYGENFNPRYLQAARHLHAETPAPIALTAKKIIARRAFMELLGSERPVVNLGVGTPELIAAVAREEVNQNFVLTVESGVIGGHPAGGLSFGASLHPEAIIDQAALFDFYDGGGIDVAFLGCAEVDSYGNVNVSRFGTRTMGAGGFINISQTAKKVVFCGTFTAGGLSARAESGLLRIDCEGSIKKFVTRVGQITYRAALGLARGQELLYITERAVFKLVAGKLNLVEVAPGIDIEKHILAPSDADIVVSRDVAQMDRRIFETGPMCRRRLAS